MRREVACPPAMMWAAALLSGVLWLFAGQALSQPLSRAVVQERARQPEQLFNWYYAAIYGTGAYRIGEETVGVLRLPFGHRLREASDERWGLRVTLPVTAALAEFDLTDFQLGRVRAAGVSVLPGIEAEIPLAPGWTLKPFANAGGGWDFKNDGSAMIHSAGVAAVRKGTLDNGWRSTLGTRLTFAGYKAGDESSRLAALDGGGGIDVPVDFEIGGRPVQVGLQLVGTVYFNRLEFLLPGSAEKEVLGEVEVAVTLGVRKPVEIFGAAFDRVGLGFRKGTDGLKGIRLVGSFPF